MRQNYLSYILIIIVSISSAYSQSSPFNCVTEAYLFQNNDVYAQNLASGSANLDGINLTPANINGVGYNSKDGYIWGSLKSPSNTIVRIGNNYEVTTYTVANAPFSYVGDVNQDGIYYMKNGSSSYNMIDLDPDSSAYLTNIGSGTLSEAITNHDWAFNSVDNMLYTVEKNTNILFRINPQTGNVQSLGEVPILSGLSYTYGAVYFDVDGNFYVSANQTGTVYVVYAVQNVAQSSDMTSNLFAYGPSSSSNDGARCPTAPVPQENCTNGIDDDGDGLSDCDDPSCSGVSACPVYSSTSTGNNGGLESNNRLSQRIGQRNLNRFKTNYRFDINKARRIDKQFITELQARNNNITLWDFIPTEAIAQASAVESSPSDLVEITNAVDVLSVDYIKNEEAIGTLLVLKTEDKVYEHTKHICDRFTGSQLLSVSNLEVNEEKFLQSVVKREDGKIEFVASFSARIGSNDTFHVESHWNLDKYTPNEGFYNFQVWASSVDDLYKLVEEVVKLIDEQKSIEDYTHSEAPPVYIRKASYAKGNMNLEIINTLGNTNVVLEGNKRSTETEVEENKSYTINLESYVNNITVDTGNLYDFGFRLKNSYDMTPDDLFISDGTWGIDYSSQPFIDEFLVSQNEEDFLDDVYGIERKISVQTTTNQDVSIYRSLTPKFSPVDLSEYGKLSLKAKGTGTLKVTLVKEGIDSWEDQPSLNITLSTTKKQYMFNVSDFEGINDSEDYKDVKMLFFTLVANGNGTENKDLEIESIQFSNRATASTDEVIKNKEVIFSPNPMTNVGEFKFNTETNGVCSIKIYSILGELVEVKKQEVYAGHNTIKLHKDKLSDGIYMYKLTYDNEEVRGKIVIK